jgi:activin receptor type-1
VTCWKSRVRDSEGYERVSRGCTTKTEHLPVYCVGNFNNGQKKREVSGFVYNMECCTSDYCNNGSFPVLPPLKTELPDEGGIDEIYKLVMAVVAPAVIVLAIALAVILCMRKKHKKRLIDARIQQDADTYYATDDLLKRSHACGDSTLRVSRENLPVIPL